MSIDASQAICVECGQTFLQVNMVSLNRRWVCAACKPLFLQRLAEGVSIPAGAEGMGRFKRDLIMRRDAPLPDLCLRCNAPAAGFRLKRKLSWHPRAYYFLILLGVLIYAIVALVVRKKAVVEVGLCENHRSRRRSIIVGCWAAALLGIGMLVYASESPLAVLGVFLILGAPIFGLFKSRIVYASRIDEDYVWVRGADESFLSTLPEWAGMK